MYWNANTVGIVSVFLIFTLKNEVHMPEEYELFNQLKIEFTPLPSTEYKNRVERLCLFGFVRDDFVVIKIAFPVCFPNMISNKMVLSGAAKIIYVPYIQSLILQRYKEEN